MYSSLTSFIRLSFSSTCFSNFSFSFSSWRIFLLSSSFSFNSFFMLSILFSSLCILHSFSFTFCFKLLISLIFLSYSIILGFFSFNKLILFINSFFSSSLASCFAKSSFASFNSCLICFILSCIFFRSLILTSSLFLNFKSSDST